MGIIRINNYIKIIINNNYFIKFNKPEFYKPVIYSKYPHVVKHGKIDITKNAYVNNLYLVLNV